MAYIGNIPVPQATQTRDRFTATSGQTTFATSGYTPGFLDVYLNGVHLDASDYTATNGSDVVLDTGAATDDIVEVVAFTAFNVSEKLPDQTGNAGEYLTTDGSALSWGEITDPTPAAVSGQANSATDFFALPSGTTAQRPGSPAEGYIRYNTDDDVVEVYSNGEWVAVSDNTPSYDAEILIVGGGGGGGEDNGGGGGGGEVVTAAAFNVPVGTEYSLVIGAGAAAQTSSGLRGGKGTDSTGFGVTARGGGGGGGVSQGTITPDTTVGNGGGGSGYLAPTEQDASPSSAVTGFSFFGGYDGGAGTNGTGGYFNAGGGGGAGAVGNNGSTSTSGGADGGDGVASSITGTSYYWGGGGGGGTNNGAGGDGGQGGGGGGHGPGGGGNGDTSGINNGEDGGFPAGGDGGANTGGGGGGGRRSSDTNGGAGGSGIIVIKYAGAQRGTGGTVTTSGGFTRHTFTTSGSFTFTA